VKPGVLQDPVLGPLTLTTYPQLSIHSPNLRALLIILVSITINPTAITLKTALLMPLLSLTNGLKQINLNFDKIKLMKFVTNNKICINVNRDNKSC
jgi:hypothetical protein